MAEGAAHIYPRLAPTSEWDTCAAQAIVECAGGKVLQHPGGEGDCEAGQPVRYNKENLLNPHFVVYGKVVVKKKKRAQKEAAFGDDEDGEAKGPSPLMLGAVAVLGLAAYLALK